MLNLLAQLLFTLLLWSLRVGAAVFAVIALSDFFSLAPDRVFYPGELEWMEGGIQSHVVRVAEGLPLYAAPSIEFTAYIYTPFYYFVCALVGKIFGYGLPVLRLVSLVSFVGTLVVIVLWTFKKTRTVLPGIIGAGLYGATFRLGGAWFDIARGDSLLVFLLLLGAFLVLEGKSKGSAVAGAIVLVLAFLTKQSAVVPVAGLITSSWLSGEKRDRLFSGFALFGFLLSWLGLHLSTDGWFTYYVFEMPSMHGVFPEWKLWYFQRDLLGVLAISSFVLTAEAVASTEDKKRWVTSLGFLAFTVGIGGMTWSSRIHIGMYDNVLMPLHALLGLGVALLLGRSLTRARSTALQAAVVLGALGTLWNLEYPVEAQRPTAGHVEAHKAFVARLKTLPQGTWVPYHSSAARSAGHAPRAHWMAITDADRGSRQVADKLHKDAEAWLKAHTAPAIVWSINDPSTAWFYEPMTRYYRRAGRISGAPPLTGWGQVPREIWVPRTAADREREAAQRRRARQVNTVHQSGER